MSAVDEIRSLVSFVTQAAPNASGAHLLLIAPYRARPQLRTATDYRGAGSVAGLGFYVGTIWATARSVRDFSACSPISSFS